MLNQDRFPITAFKCAMQILLALRASFCSPRQQMALFSCYRCGLHLWLYLIRQPAVHLWNLLRSCHLSNIWQPFVSTYKMRTEPSPWQLKELHVPRSVPWLEQEKAQVTAQQLWRLSSITLSLSPMSCSALWLCALHWWFHLVLVILHFLLCKSLFPFVSLWGVSPVCLSSRLFPCLFIVVWILFTGFAFPFCSLFDDCDWCYSQ